MFKSIKLFRTLKEGFVNFYRDKWLTVATIMIMTLTLYLIGATMLLWLGVSETVRNIEKRINISVNFDFTIPEDIIKEIKIELEEKEIEEISNITFVSREEAFNEFREQEKDNPDIQKALEIIDGNPLPASLIIVAEDASDYAKIDEYFKQEYQGIILDTNFNKNRDTISQIRERIVFIRNAVFFLSTLFILIAILVTFNTIRMSIYAHRNEFEVMRLVGASNRYVKIPVMTEGLLYGLTSALLAVILLMLTLYIIDPFAQRSLESAHIFEFYRTSFLPVAGGVIVASITLGLISSYIAIHRYLK